jgi:hypothetical protein
MADDGSPRRWLAGLFTENYKFEQIVIAARTKEA